MPKKKNESKLTLKEKVNLVQTCQAEKFLKRRPSFKGKKKKCNSTKIALTIGVKGKEYPVCQKCWDRISASDIEWSSLP